MLKKEGFQDVCKLRGGVQHYGNTLGARHWEGRLFVFDRRDSIAVGKYDEASVVGRCHVCGKPCEEVWNCHNYECNRTMVACEQCMQSMKGCCCTLVDQGQVGVPKACEICKGWGSSPFSWAYKHGDTCNHIYQIIMTRFCPLLIGNFII